MGDEDVDDQQREALARATTRLLSSRSLLKNLSDNEEVIHTLSQDQERDVEGGFVKVDKKEVDAKTTLSAESSSSQNVVIATNEVALDRQSVVTEVETTEESSPLLVTSSSNEVEEEKEETLNPSIFTSLGV